MASNSTDKRPKIGLALGSGAARGWAHAGVYRALDELGVTVDVVAGCSAGALISAAKLLGIWDEFAQWGQSMGPLAASKQFALGLSRGGFINPDKAFDRFKDADRDIEGLPIPWGAVATDLGTGQEVWLTQGSVLSACRGSSAIPIVFQAAHHTIGKSDHWLIDGGASNPVPVSLARALGADFVIAVDLNCVTLALSRFDRPTTRAVVPVPADVDDAPSGVLGPPVRALKSQRRDLLRRLALWKARGQSSPQLLETSMATLDIIQGQLAEARARVDIADVRLTPDLSVASAANFDAWELFESIGYETTMAAQDKIRALTNN